MTEFYSSPISSPPAPRNNQDVRNYFPRANVPIVNDLVGIFLQYNWPATQAAVVITGESVRMNEAFVRARSEISICVNLIFIFSLLSEEALKCNFNKTIPKTLTGFVLC